MVRKDKSDLHTQAGGSPNQLLVMNGREGRVTITLRSKGAGKGTRCGWSWFPPRDDARTARVCNRETCKGVGRDLLAVHAADPGKAYTFALAIVRGRGPDAVESMRRWIEAGKGAGVAFAAIDIDQLSNVNARMVRVRSTA